MPTAVGPNTKGEENLVFGYDLGDVSNSYRGEPTVNMINGGSTRANGSGTAGERDFAGIVVEVTDGYYYSAERPHTLRLVCTATGSNGYKEFAQQTDGTYGNTSGNTYIYSFDYKFVVPNDSGTGAMGTPFVYGDGYKVPDSGTRQANVSQTDYPLKDGWTRRVFKYDATYTGNNYYRTNIHSNGYYYEVLLDNFQIQENTHVTPFTPSTRSATQGLIDLTGNSTIDLTNVSFDSNAQMTFDGSNDYVYINDTLLNVDAFTVEAVVNITSDGNYNKTILFVGDSVNDGIWFFKHRSGLGNRLVMHGYDGVNSRIDVISTDQVPNAQNVYVAVTFNGSTYQLYIDGEPNGSAVTSNKVAASTDNWIGKIGSTYMQGDIFNLKMYNRGLTASEIKANYNAIKGRFNI